MNRSEKKMILINLEFLLVNALKRQAIEPVQDSYDEMK